ncbi:YbaB/EbfC family nucleoid-associated protein [Amycolatopsis jiangsuensis]|uniref:DNA-binding protein YbaB n=1 Tax=Amycolatopsis jiangsuensis TaxID=1181879 RepID=A0A840J3A9_9PSEU|nr:YbaB/EbfC family nucleoid-associated protein [Amycolatopsis jiangsuensis]MBB4688363.1 DNA-binding protein YbaB [Amycolatopsis jiangsuensis]
MRTDPVDPAEWLAGYDRTLARAAANARAASESLREAGGRAASPRGEVEVEVGPSGTLTGLRLSPGARALEAEALARLILATVQDAHREAAARVVDIMSEYVGDGPALQLVRDNLPAEPDAAPSRRDDDYFADVAGVIR